MRKVLHHVSPWRVLIAVVALWFGWAVVSSYAYEPNATSVRLDGLELSLESQLTDQSPYRLVKATDARTNDVALAYVDSEPAARPAAGPHEVLGGTSVVKGMVTHKGDPVGGATVRLERETSEGVATLDVVTDETGSYRAHSLLGGRYRVRSWLPGRLTTTRVEVFHLAESSSVENVRRRMRGANGGKFVEQVDFELVDYGQKAATIALVDSGPYYIGGSGRAAISVSKKLVDANGLVLTAPVVGKHVLFELSGPMEIIESNRVTSAQGSAYITLECQGLGAVSLKVTVFDGDPMSSDALVVASGAFGMSGCVPISSPTTSTVLRDADEE